MIIGLTGLAGSGKSTAAEYLVREHGFIRQGFAWPLKKMLRTLNPAIKCARSSDHVPLSILLDIYGGDEIAIKESEYGKDYRRLLQVLGTDCIRAVDPDFWVKAAMKDLDPEKDYVFDDVRFPNEARAISAAENFERNGLLIHVDRPGLVRGDHPSEQHAGFMYENAGVVNAGGIGDLHLQLDVVLAGFKVLA